MNVLFKSGLYGSFPNEIKRQKSLLDEKIIAFFVGSYGSND